jgi:hypothetical protein
MGPHTVAAYEHGLNAVEGIGLTDLEMDSVLLLVQAYAQGAARGAVDAAQAEKQTGITDQQWWEAHAPVLDKVMDASKFPVATRVGTTAGETHQAAYNPQHAFEFGLERVLDGVATLIGSR